MARYSGVRRRERRKLDRAMECLGDDGAKAPSAFKLTAHGALEHILRQAREASEHLDNRTNPGKVLLAAINRAQVLQWELRR